MSESNIAVFFYGLFMDESLLASKGVEPSGKAIGYVDGYRLRIGARATLVPDKASRAYGVLMTIGRGEATELYSGETVADYVPEPVSVTVSRGITEPAICYNLPPDKLAGTNSAYAESLLLLAKRLGFPEDYRDAIRMEGNLD
jgi:Gamma-glutamyl cyclotransferase, AIG2-like